MFLLKEKNSWQNWSASVLASPNQFVQPANLEELIMFVKQCAQNNITMRVVGAGHSFTPLVATSEVLLSLDNLAGIDTIDSEDGLITVWAGTRLKDLGPMLHELGYAMENLGDINVQSVAGAISTGTHGTGIQFGSIPNQVNGLTILTAKGELIDISRENNPEYFDAARVSLGMLGIIVKVQLKAIPAYQLVGNSYRLSLNDGLTSLDSLKTENRNFEFFWFPYTETIQVKTLNKIETSIEMQEKQQTFKKVVVENGLFWMLSEMSRIVPRTAKMVSTVSALGVPVGEESNESYLLYATPRLVKFQEMEYSVPEAAMADVIRDINNMLHKKKYPVHFPIECRYVKGDDIWLSPSYNRDSAYIAVHMYKGMEFFAYFDAVEEIFQAYDGRPHWGKMHTANYDQLSSMYPKLDDFLYVRNEFDQQGQFLNEYLRTLFQLENV